nr:hypothetical protein [Bradyrhizobium manausense]
MFGLGGGVITGDIARGECVAAEVESGNVFVNDNVRSAATLRRCQAKRLWSRAFALWHQGVRQYQDGRGGLRRAQIDTRQRCD